VAATDGSKVHKRNYFYPKLYLYRYRNALQFNCLPMERHSPKQFKIKLNIHPSKRAGRKYLEDPFDFEDFSTLKIPTLSCRGRISLNLNIFYFLNFIGLNNSFDIGT